jgi:hypothetical protein
MTGGSHGLQLARGAYDGRAAQLQRLDGAALARSKVA